MVGLGKNLVGGQGQCDSGLYQSDNNCRWIVSQENVNRNKVTMGKKQQGCSCKIRNIFVREFLAEFLGRKDSEKYVLIVSLSGIFVLVTFGTASIAQSVLSLRTKGSFFSINWG
jgi:hypothetical protein